MTDFWLAGRRHGLLTRVFLDGVAVAPPLIIDDDQQEMIVTRLGSALDDILRLVVPVPAG